MKATGNSRKYYKGNFTIKVFCMKGVEVNFNINITSFNIVWENYANKTILKLSKNQFKYAGN